MDNNISNIDYTDFEGIQNEFDKTENMWHFIHDLHWYDVSKACEEDAVRFVSAVILNDMEYQDARISPPRNPSLPYNADELAEIQRMIVQERMDLEDFINNYLDSISPRERAEYKLTKEQTMGLASHIVGLGYEMYSYVFDNPSMIFTLQNQYVERFEDVFDKAIMELSNNTEEAEEINS